MAYTLIVNGERFNLTKEQLESDPDNYFTTYFCGSFSEASEGKKELMIEKEPAIFRLIQAHLRGYNVLPIPEGYIPYMSKEVVLGNFLKEAEFYALGNLVKKIREFQLTDSPSLTQLKYKFRSVLYGRKDIYTRDLTGVEYQSVLSNGGGRYWGWHEGHDILAMNGYSALISWTDYPANGLTSCCVILVLDE